MIKFGFNIDAGAIEDRPYLVNVLKNGDFKAHLVMSTPPPNDDAKKEIEQSVVRLRDEVGKPGVRWIYRRYSSKEGNWRQFSVDEEARRWDREGYKDIIRQDPANEPGDTDNAEYVKSRVKLLEHAHNAGITLCVGTWGVGGPHESHIANGVYDELISAVVRFGGMIDVHEYVPIMPEFGSMYSYDAILDPTKYSLYEVDEPWVVRHEHYLARRLDNWLLRADAIGVQRPTVNLSEVLWDKIPDAESKLNAKGGLWDAFQRQYGSGPTMNNDIRGVMSLANVFKAAYPDLSYSQALFHTWKRWYEMLYADRPEVFSAQAFQWGRIWRFPATHDWSYKPLEPFVNSIVSYSRNSVPPPPTTEPPIVPDPNVIPMRQVKVKGKTVGVRVRKRPQLNGTILSTTVLDAEKTAAVSFDAAWKADGHDWYHIVVDGVDGYVAASVVTIVPLDFETTEKERELLIAWRSGQLEKMVKLIARDNVAFIDIEEVELLKRVRLGMFRRSVEHLLVMIERSDNVEL